MVRPRIRSLACFTIAGLAAVTACRSGPPYGTVPASEWVIEKPALMVSTNPKPTYPTELLASRDTGTVRIRVLVSASGRADMSTVEVLESPHRAFTRAVLDVLPTYRFIAAEVGGTIGGPCRRSGDVEICEQGKPGKKVSQPVDIQFVFAPPTMGVCPLARVVPTRRPLGVERTEALGGDG